MLDLNIFDPSMRIRKPRRARATVPILDRLASKIDYLGPVPEYAPRLGSCWVWTGTKSKQGYGLISTTRALGCALAHRCSYAAAFGRIPDGYQIDHLCRNRACVNPAHLEAVTPRENNLRGTSPAAINAAKTHCIRGHPLSGSNLVTEGCDRKCKICRAATARKTRSNRSADAIARQREYKRLYMSERRNDPAFVEKVNARKREMRRLKKKQLASD